MNRRSLGLDYLDHVFNAERSIFRLEQQPIYAADLDPRYWPDYEAWLRQEPRHVDETDPVWGEWISQTRKLAARGVPLMRVRVIDDPPTEYQRWTAFTAAHLNNPNGRGDSLPRPQRCGRSWDLNRRGRLVGDRRLNRAPNVLRGGRMASRCAASDG